MAEDLAWNVFAMTGEIDAYLLYKNAELPREAAQFAEKKQGQTDEEVAYGIFKDGRRCAQTDERWRQ